MSFITRLQGFLGLLFSKHRFPGEEAEHWAAQYFPDCQQVAAKVVRVVCLETEVGLDKLDANTHLAGDLHFNDSLDAVELVMHLEEVFEVTIPDEDAATIGTVGDLISYLNGRVLLATRTGA